MKVVLFLLIFTYSLMAFAQKSQCIVISGLERDKNSAFWEFKDKNLYKDCTVYPSFKEFAKTNPQNNTIDLRVISHGKKDGTIQCNAADESPKEVLNYINQIAQANKAFITLDSCYSEQVLKEKVLLENSNKNFRPSLKNTCLYAASAPLRETYIDEKTFADLHFKNGEGPKNISVLDLYKQTSAGLLSAAPYNQAGISDYWSGGNLQVALKRYLKTIDKLISSVGLLPVKKCQTMLLVNKLSPEDFSNLSISIQKMKNAERMFKLSDDKWRELMSSFDRLTKKEGTKEFFQEWLNKGPDEAYYSDIYKICKLHAPEEAYCKKIITKGKDSYTVDAIFEQRKLTELLQQSSNKKIDHFQYVSSDQFVSALVENLTTKENSFNQDSFHAIMGNNPGNSQVSRIGIPESEEVNWAGYLGSFNRLSLANKDKQKWKESKDKARYKACEQFYYDNNGKLQAK